MKYKKIVELDNNGILYIDGKRIGLTKDQKEELGIKENPFDISEGDKVFYKNILGKIGEIYFDSSDNENVIMKDCGKLINNENIIKQRALRENLNDLMFQFAVENNYLSDEVSNSEKKKYVIIINYTSEDLYAEIKCVKAILHLNEIYFNSTKGSQECIEKIIKPYFEKYEEEWDWDYNY